MSDESRVDSYKLLDRLQILGGLGCLVIFLYACRFGTSGDTLRIATVGMLVAGASLLAAFLMGFIFGIPRIGGKTSTATAAAEPGGAHAAASDAPSDRVKSNDNLIEISDWLTKILVGVGLVELNAIPGKLVRLAQFLQPGLQPAQCAGNPTCTDFAAGAQATGLTIVVFYFALGFLWGYIWTRLYFERDLGATVAKLKQDKRVTDLIMAAETSLNNGQLDEAVQAVDKALKNDPRDGRAVITKGRILKRKAMRADQPQAHRLLQEALDSADAAIALLPGRAEPIYNKACYEALLGLDKSQILHTLESAFALDPDLQSIAPNDDDLASLHGDPDFRRLVSRGSGAVETEPIT